MLPFVCCFLFVDVLVLVVVVVAVAVVSSLSRLGPWEVV